MRERQIVAGAIVLSILATIFVIGCYFWWLLIGILLGWSGSHLPCPSDLAALGDYVGGVLGPILALIAFSAGLLIALELRQYLVRPFPYVYCGDYLDQVYVGLKNIGKGPLFIDSLEFKSNEESKKYLVELMPNLPADKLWGDFAIMDTQPVIPEGDEIQFLFLRTTMDDREDCRFRDDVRKALRDVWVILEYSDMHGRKQGVYRKKLLVFGRDRLNSESTTERPKE